MSVQPAACARASVETSGAMIDPARTRAPARTARRTVRARAHEMLSMNQDPQGRPGPGPGHLLHISERGARPRPKRARPSKSSRVRAGKATEMWRLWRQTGAARPETEVV